MYIHGALTICYRCRVAFDFFPCSQSSFMHCFSVALNKRLVSATVHAGYDHKTSTFVPLCTHPFPQVHPYALGCFPSPQSYLLPHHSRTSSGSIFRRKKTTTLGPRYLHSMGYMVRISVLKIAEIGAFEGTICMSAILEKKGSFVKNSRKSDDM